MKRNIFGALTTLVLALVINVPVVYAQSKTKADIPFGFTVAGTTMPAGTYTISGVGGATKVQNAGTNATVFVIGQHEERLVPQSPRLVFHVYGDKYFLAEAWGSSGDTGTEFPVSQRERELRMASKDAYGPQEVVVALR